MDKRIFMNFDSLIYSHVRARLPHSSVCAPGVPGHPREQREADRRAEEDVGTERRFLDKRVREEGMKCRVKQL